MVYFLWVQHKTWDPGITQSCCYRDHSATIKDNVNTKTEGGGGVLFRLFEANKQQIFWHKTELPIL